MIMWHLCGQCLLFVDFKDIQTRREHYSIGIFVAVIARVQLLSQDKFNRHVLNDLMTVCHMHVHWGPRSHYTLFPPPHPPHTGYILVVLHTNNFVLSSALAYLQINVFFRTLTPWGGNRDGSEVVQWADAIIVGTFIQKHATRMQLQWTDWP